MEPVGGEGERNTRNVPTELFHMVVRRGKSLLIHSFIHSPAAVSALNKISHCCRRRSRRKQEVDAECCGTRRHVHRDGLRFVRPAARFICSG